MPKPIPRPARNCFLPYNGSRKKVCLVNSSRIDVAVPRNSHGLSKVELHYLMPNKRTIQSQGGLKDAGLERIRLFFGNGKNQRTVEYTGDQNYLFIYFIHVAAALDLKSSFSHLSPKQNTSTLKLLMSLVNDDIRDYNRVAKTKTSAPPTTLVMKSIYNGGAKIFANGHLVMSAPPPKKP